MGQDIMMLTLLPSVDTFIEHSFPECLWSSLWIYAWFRSPNAGIVYEPDYQSHCQSLSYRPLSRYDGNYGWLGQVYKLR